MFYINNNIAKILFLVIVLISTTSSLVINSTKIFSVLAIDDVLILESGADLQFVNPVLTVAPLVNLIVNGDAKISSNTPLQITFSSLNSSNTISSKLSLKNINLFINNESTCQDIQIDFPTNSGTVTFQKSVTFVYSKVPSGSTIFNGGEIFIANGSTTRVLGNEASTYNINSKINNEYIFLCQPKLKIAPTNLIGAPNSVFYIFDFLAPSTGSMTLTNGTLFFKHIDLAGGTLTLVNSVWSLTTGTAAVTAVVENTNIVLGENSIITYQRQYIKDPLGLIYLKTTGSLNVQSPSTLTVLFNLDMLIYVPKSYQSQLIFSESGTINCNNAENARFQNNSKTAPTIQIQPTNAGGFNLGNIDAVMVCSKQGFSSRIFSILNTGDSIATAPPCPNGYIRCMAGFNPMKCVNATSNPCNVVCTSLSTNNFNEQKVLPTETLPMKLRSLMQINNDVPTKQSNFTCWNGECFSEPSLCSPYPACPPSLPTRCPGFCAVRGFNCESVINCANNKTHPLPCESGCSSSGLCDPYDGCGLNQYMCDNMACVSKAEECNNYVINGNKDQLLELSYKFIPSTSDLFPKMVSYVPLWVRSINTSLIEPYTHVVISGDGAINDNETTSSVLPYADSLARDIVGTGINPDFDYYKHILSGVFNIKINGRNQSEFGNGSNVSVIFSNVRTNVSVSDLCLAFINPKGEWECTEFPVVQLENGGVAATTNHFTSFALLLKTKKDDQPTNSKKMIIIVCTVIGGVILAAVSVGLFINFKLKHRSFRRWSVHRSDPNMSNSHRFRLRSYSSADKLDSTGKPITP